MLKLMLNFTVIFNFKYAVKYQSFEYFAHRTYIYKWSIVFNFISGAFLCTGFIFHTNNCSGIRLKL